MHRLWEHLIRPILEANESRVIVEIGTDNGRHTEKILTYCTAHDATLHTVGPAPRVSDEKIAAWGERVVMHRTTSVEALETIGRYDTVIIDGDHNVHTVIAELRYIQQQTAADFPLILLHDIGWPDGYGAQAVGEKNEVLVAVEHFLEESMLDLRLTILPGFHGLGIIVSGPLLQLKPALKKFIESLDRDTYLKPHVVLLEQHRIELHQQQEALQKEVSILRNELDRVSEQFSTVRQEREVLRQQLLRHETEQSEVRQQMAVLAQENERAKSSMQQVQMLTQKIVEMSGKQEEWQQTIEASEEEKAKTKTEMTAMQQRIANFDAEHAGYVLEIASLKKTLSRMEEIEKDRDQLRERFASHEIDRQMLTKKAKDALQERDRAGEKMKLLTAQLAADATERDQLSKQILELQHSLSEQKNDTTIVESLETELQTLRAQHVRLQHTATVAQQAASEADKMQTELVRLRAEYAQLTTSRSWRWTAPIRNASSSLNISSKKIGYAIITDLHRVWTTLGQPFPQFTQFVRQKMLGRIWPVRQKNDASETGTPEVFIASKKERPIADVCVIIPCHSETPHLRDTLESILAQSMRAKRIIITDNTATGSTKTVADAFALHGVEYVHGQWSDDAAMRNAGASMTQSEFILFMDGNDMLAAHYIEQCMETMRDARVAIAYGDTREHDEKNTVHIAPAFDRDLLLRADHISSHALLRRQAFDLVGGYRSLKNAHEDWDLYRRILLYTWQARKADTHVVRRMHTDETAPTMTRTYAEQASLLTLPITIFTPFAGRKEILPMFAASIKQLNVDPSMIRLHWFDTTNDASFGQLLKDELSTMHVGRTTYSSAPLPASWGHTPTSLIQQRVSNADRAQYYYEMAVVYAYNSLLVSCDTEYALVLEDDVLLSPDALTKMLQTFEADVSAVVAHYPCHLQGYSMVWHVDGNGYPVHFPERKTGVEEVGGSGFGCSLFRISDLRTQPIFTRVFDSPPYWYDYNAFLHLHTKGKVLCNWDVDVTHVKTERFKQPQQTLIAQITSQKA